jgi:ubiquinone/menaquinone biosynthesis C-methylase UbiE
MTPYPQVRRLYDRMAPFYAPAMRLFPMWRRYCEAALPWLPDGGAVLEIGPGPGVLLAEIAERARFAAGLDLSPAMLRRTQRRLRQIGRSPRLVEGNAICLPLASESLDAVALTFVFSAIPDGQAAIDELARVLRPGGVLVLVDAWDPGPARRVAHFLARVWTLFGDVMRDEATLMRAAGLDVIAQRAFGAFDSVRITVGRKA